MGDFRKAKLDEVYCSDATFNKVVNVIYNLIDSHGITPSELRQAIFLAHYKYEMENPKVMSNRVLMSMESIYNPKGLKDE